MTKPFLIQPYWSNDLSTWVFDDACVGLVEEPFVKGAEIILDELASGIPDSRNGFRLFFSDSPFSGFQRSLTLMREDDGGGWYGLDDSPLEGWLCPALFKYFSEAPVKLYAKAEPRRE